MSIIQRIMRTLFIIVVALPIAAYLGYVALFYFNQRTLLFPGTDREPYIFDEAPDLIAATFPADDLQGFAWYLPPENPPLDAQKTLIIAHGNGEINDDWVGWAEILQERGVGVLLIEYPGYGHAAGYPAKETIVPSALAAYDWVLGQPGVSGDELYLFGHSIGSGAVNAIAAERETAGMILLSPFASIMHLARDRYLPGFLVRDRFHNVAVLRSYDEPVLIMHGVQDSLIPFAHAERLHAATMDSELVPLECGHGGCIADIHLFWDRVEQFIDG